MPHCTCADVESISESVSDVPSAAGFEPYRYPAEAAPAYRTADARTSRTHRGRFRAGSGARHSPRARRSNGERHLPEAQAFAPQLPRAKKPFVGRVAETSAPGNHRLGQWPEFSVEVHGPRLLMPHDDFPARQLRASCAPVVT